MLGSTLTELLIFSDNQSDFCILGELLAVDGWHSKPLPWQIQYLLDLDFDSPLFCIQLDQLELGVIGVQLQLTDRSFRRRLFHQHDVCRGFGYLCAKRPFRNAKTMSDRVSRWFKQAGVNFITGHSVRKLVSTELAGTGATDEEMNGALGLTGAQTSKIYTRKADRAILSKNAVTRLMNEKSATPGDPVWQIAGNYKRNQM